MALVNKIKNIKTDLINVFNRFPLTILFLFIVSIIGIVFIFSEKDNIELIEALGVGTLLSMGLELSFEYKFIDKKTNLLYLIPVVFSILCYSVLAIFDNMYTRIAVIGIGIALFAFILYILYIDRENKLLFSHLIKSKFITGLFASILLSGITVCVLAFNFLIFKFDDIWKILSLFSILIAFLGNYLLFFSYIPKKDEEIEVPKIYRTIIHKALFYVYLLLIFILYLYILKVILIHKMPVGKFNWFGCFSLLFYCIFYLSVDETDGIVQEKFKKFGALLMIPILIMQIIGLYIRISSYGLTTLRYMSIICIIAACMFIVSSIFKINIRKTFIGIMILSLLVTCTPLNVLDVPLRNQESILKNSLSKAGVYTTTSDSNSFDEKVKIEDKYMPAILSSYDYIRSSSGRKSKFFKEFEKTKLIKQLDYNEYVTNNIRSYYYYAEQLDKKIDISKYSTVRKVENDSAKFEGIDYTDFFLSLKEDNSKNIVYKTDNMLILFTDISYDFNEIDQEMDTIYWTAYVYEK